MGSLKQNTFGSTPDKMAHLINLSPVTILIAFVVFVTITEASHCNRLNKSKEGFKKVHQQDLKTVYQFIEAGWLRSYNENVIVKGIRKAYRYNVGFDYDQYEIGCVCMQNDHSKMFVKYIYGYIGKAGPVFKEICGVEYFPLKPKK